MGGSTKKAQKYVADRTGYSGSDAEKAANKVTEEGSKVTEKIKEEGGKIASGDVNLKRAVSGTMAGAESTFKKSDLGVKAAEFQNYVMERLGRGKKNDDDDTPGASATVGQSATMGQGATEGMKAGANLASGRDRVRQNKRKLRATKTA